MTRTRKAPLTHPMIDDSAPRRPRAAGLGRWLAQFLLPLAVLAVRRPGPRGEVRAGDAGAVLLPAGADRGGLPVLRAAKRPAGRPGTAWDDSHGSAAGIRAAAAVAGYLAPHRSVLGLD